MSIATEFVVGHPEMDAQHNAIQHLIRDVHQAMGGEDLPETLRALEALWNGCVSHFANEDSMMEEYAYPERNPHRTAHHLFLEDLKELVRVAQRDGLTENVATWALKRVPEWIAFHIEANDAPLARFLAKKTAARMMAGVRGDKIQKPSRRDA